MSTKAHAAGLGPIATPDLRPLAWALATLGLGIMAFAVEMTYARLHLYVLIPGAILAFVPKRPLSWASPAVRRLGYIAPIPLAVTAVVFSAFWDNLIFSKGVFTFDRSTMLGTMLHLPLEEWFWFIDHTLLASFFTLTLMNHAQPQRPMPEGDSLVRLGGVAVCAVLSVVGVWLVLQPNEHLLFLGVNLAFMFPVLGLHWWVGSHILLQNKRVWLLGVAIPSLYLLGLDYWALEAGIWHLSPHYITGIKIFDIYFEQILIYTLPTILVVQTILLVMRMGESMLAQSDRGELDGGIFRGLMGALRHRIP
ncbi:MAG TPA: hypothetical protein DIU15_19405 [Deltaproteobacteria bacterium]|nr:hypothetical protein [Deltaproteobacteria bacterium]HCP48215.1 hypothetical protein [Deltaproteobacteria bacterium]